jgi:hypothetical protein
MPRALMRARRSPAGGAVLRVVKEESKPLFSSQEKEELRQSVDRDRVLLRQVQAEMAALVSKLEACRKVELILLSRIQRYA